MINLIHEFEEYLNDDLAMHVVAESWSGTGRIPLFLRDFYSFYTANLLNVACLLMVPKTREAQTPATVKKHLLQVQDKWDGEVIFLDRAVSSHNRKRLIEHQVPFVVPGNQMYLPMLGIDLREHFRKLRQIKPQFSPSTQVLVLNAIYRIVDGQILTPSEMAQRLNYSAMTMTRAFDELESVGIGEHSAKGKERYIRFKVSGKGLWDKALPFMRTPVKKRLHVLGLHPDARAMHAGLTALAHYSMLSEPENAVFAFGIDAWKSFLKQHKITEVTIPEPGSAEVELWRYSPASHARDGFVDPLSLFLSLKENWDERVEAALQAMIEKLPW